MPSGNSLPSVSLQSVTWSELGWVKIGSTLHWRTPMSWWCHVICLCAASTHLKSSYQDMHQTHLSVPNNPPQNPPPVVPAPQPEPAPEDTEHAKTMKAVSAVQCGCRQAIINHAKRIEILLVCHRQFQMDNRSSSMEGKRLVVCWGQSNPSDDSMQKTHCVRISIVGTTPVAMAALSS